jgi:hypothetical protein
LVCLVADEDADLQVISRCVEVIEGGGLTSDLELVILKEDIFASQALLLVFIALLVIGDILLNLNIVHLRIIMKKQGIKADCNYER